MRACSREYSAGAPGRGRFFLGGSFLRGRSEGSKKIRRAFSCRRGRGGFWFGTQAVSVMPAGEDRPGDGEKSREFFPKPVNVNIQFSGERIFDPESRIEERAGQKFTSAVEKERKKTVFGVFGIRKNSKEFFFVAPVWKAGLFPREAGKRRASVFVQKSGSAGRGVLHSSTVPSGSLPNSGERLGALNSPVRSREPAEDRRALRGIVPFRGYPSG